jgi:hypothetical protein
MTKVIGVDFDNTIVCYDDVFYRAAVAEGLIPASVTSSKSGIRDYLRQAGQEDRWTELQGLIYGVYIQQAPAFAGVLDFFKECRTRKVHVRIVSHKTKHPFIGQKHDLPAAAMGWLEAKGFFSAAIGLSPEYVFLEPTKEAKIARIKAAGCTHFIDDLPEFLGSADFPGGVERILFDPHDAYQTAAFRRAASWGEISGLFFPEGAGA